jgi:hypothetical protein
MTRTVLVWLVAEGVVGTGCSADPSRVLLGMMSRQGGYWHVVAAVGVVGARGGTHPCRIVVAGRSSVRNIGVIRG